jgi:hypothetical protein
VLFDADAIEFFLASGLLPSDAVKNSIPYPSSTSQGGYGGDRSPTLSSLSASSSSYPSSPVSGGGKTMIPAALALANFDSLITLTPVHAGKLFAQKSYLTCVTPSIVFSMLRSHGRNNAKEGGGQAEHRGGSHGALCRPAR